MAKVQLLLLALFFQPFSSFACHYSKLSYRHTMCIYNPRACPNSQLLKSGGLTHKDKALIVRIHNSIRSSVAGGWVSGLPPASNMRVMMWDNELAQIAQRWADQCTEGHDQYRNTRRFSVGQNVALQWTYGHRDLKWKDRPDWNSSINLWAKELAQFGFPRSYINPFHFDGNVGHYTQMIWGSTYTIGCGYAYYKHPYKGYTKIYVCNYGPGGNIIGGKMYEESRGGKKCTNPKLILSKQYSGLCEKRSLYKRMKIHRKSSKSTAGRRKQRKTRVRTKQLL
ncbi:venom allergen 5-like [Centruroides vittatus]|uniref:venom allergen 5-like n=1 Tax=Centruroides vittatus TaxID=120091 RepID=UPI003510C90A